MTVHCEDVLVARVTTEPPKIVSPYAFLLTAMATSVFKHRATETSQTLPSRAACEGQLLAGFGPERDRTKDGLQSARAFGLAISTQSLSLPLALG